MSTGEDKTGETEATNCSAGVAEVVGKVETGSGSTALITAVDPSPMITSSSLKKECYRLQNCKK